MALLNPTSGAKGVGQNHQRRPRPAECRILRYPNGEERRICYPVELADADEAGGDNVQATVQTSLPPAPAAPIAQPAPQPQADQLLFVDFAKLARQAARLGERVNASFKIHHGCPWVVPRPLFVLTLSSMFSANPSFFTMRTRIERTDQGFVDELSKVLGSSSLASKFTTSSMEDGVVAFTAREDAMRFAAMLDAERRHTDEVGVVEVGSHELFRIVGDAKGVVVSVTAVPEEEDDQGAIVSSSSNGVQGFNDDGSASLAGGGWLPEPHQLAGALRGQAGWGDDL